MAGVPIKFRCFRCNQLLGVSRSRAGAVVACPKCAIDLVVPEPEEPTTRPAPPGVSDGSISLEYLDIRPEDIRVEAGVRDAAVSYVPHSPAPEPPALDDAPWPVAETPPQAERPFVIAPQAPPSPTPYTPPPPAAPAARPRPPEEPTLPVLQLDASPISAGSRRQAPTPRSRDMVLPRSVVAAWSLFVLLALAMAFFAGLLAGHYVWRVH